MRLLAKMRVGDHVILVLDDSAVSALVAAMIDKSEVLAVSTFHVRDDNGRPAVKVTENVPHRKFSKETPYYWVPGVDDDNN